MISVMELPIHQFLTVLVLVGSTMCIHGAKYDTSLFNRSSFPKDFIFGTASSAYQFEGAYNKDGRGPSIWDTYTHQHPERIADYSNGDIAVDQYHLYKEDVALMKGMGMDAYRFSISWSRILPYGKLSGGVNRKGVQYYNNLINELLSKGLKPFVTLFHWDVPQHLEDEYGGFLSSRIITDFQDYAEVCFKEFGDRVKYWITLNEPWSFSNGGYNLGTFAPGRCSKSIGNCTWGNSAIEPYVTTHNQLLAHAAAANLYKKKYQDKQNGIIGITLISHWMVPLYQDRIHEHAAQRALDFMFGWFLDPSTYGHYPKSMQILVNTRLPNFTKEQSNMLNGSYDFLGLNYYTANYAENWPYYLQPSYLTDCQCRQTREKKGVPIGPKTVSDWLHVYPKGILELLLHIKNRYKNPIIYITENGVDEQNNTTLSLQEQLTDIMRIEYHYQHLVFANKAIKKGVDLRGYFAWSLLDNFEWSDGYTVRFGVNYVDYHTMKRYPKHSSSWFKKFLLH